MLDVIAHPNYSVENDDDMTGTSNGLVAAKAAVTEVIVSSESSSAGTRPFTAIRTAINVKKNIIENKSGSWVIDDVPTTSFGTIAAPIDFDVNVQDVVAHVNVSVGSGNASDADIEETVVTFYDSDDEPLQMSFKGTKFPTTVYSNPMPVTFMKRENDLISGDKPYEEIDVSEIDFHIKWQFVFQFFFFLLIRGVGSIPPASKSSQL